jgi:hypothetical protein
VRTHSENRYSIGEGLAGSGGSANTVVIDSLASKEWRLSSREKPITIFAHATHARTRTHTLHRTSNNREEQSKMSERERERERERKERRERDVIFFGISCDWTGKKRSIPILRRFSILK